MRRSLPLCRIGAIACLFAAIGCTGPTAPPDPTGGGATYVLDAAAYRQTVAPVLAQYGCHAVECHGGGIRGTFELSPENAPDPDFDFAQARWQVTPYDPEESPLLAMPLSAAAGGTTHPWEPFDSTEHPGYAAIRAWILSGEFE